MKDGLQTFLDGGTSFEGKISFTGSVRIDGHFRGSASADGTLIVGETGTIDAKLEVRSLVVMGSVVGRSDREGARRGRTAGSTRRRGANSTPAHRRRRALVRAHRDGRALSRAESALGAAKCGTGAD